MAPKKVYEPGTSLTDAEKGEILQDVKESKAADKAKADKAKAANWAKVSEELGIKKAGAASGSKPAAGSGAAAAGKKPATAAASGDKAPPAGSGVKAAKALSPDKKGGGGKAAGGKEKAAGGGKEKAGGKGGKAAGKEKEKQLSPEDQAKLDETREAAKKAAEEEEKRKREEEEAAAEAEREKRWAESEAQRVEIQNAIIEEERRVRKREEEKRKRFAAEKKKQQQLLETAFDGEMDDVKKIIDGWVEDCFGAELIGAKVDCMDANEHTPLSEAACGGQPEVCALLLKHGANINAPNHQGRTPLWRAAFMNKGDCVKLLLEAGGDPRIGAGGTELPEAVAASAELKELIASWPREETDRLLAEREKLLAGQWVPPPPDPADQPVGEPGYSLQIPIKRLSDALDSIVRDSDRFTLVLDLGGHAMTFFQYRDVNLAYAYRPDDVEPEKLRKKVMGALRYGKPLVVDFLSIELDRDAIVATFDAVLPGLFKMLLNKQILKEENYSKLIKDGDDPDYALDAWKPRNLEFFHFILVSKLPKLAEWCMDQFFILKVA